MINISEKCRREDYGFFEKIRSLINPDYFLAENVADYLDNFMSIPQPFYKKICYPISIKIAYFSLINVGITVCLGYERFPDPGWFMLHDATGQFVAKWVSDHPIFPCSVSFKQAQEEQGLKRDDWVYEVFFRCIFNRSNCVPSISEVTKFRPEVVSGVKKREREKIKFLLPAYNPT